MGRRMETFATEKQNKEDARSEKGKQNKEDVGSENRFACSPTKGFELRAGAIPKLSISRSR